MQTQINKLYQGLDLSITETQSAFQNFIQGNSDPVEIAAFLVALKLKGETPNEVAGAASALREQAIKFASLPYPVADSCGTGGSGKHTLNISSLVSVIAACTGLKMVKHGNRSVSSKCGSADVFEQLGVKIDMTPDVAKQCLDEAGVTFLFAPLYHPGVKNVMPVRRQLATRTIFNLLGPLINPALPAFQLMGVYAPQYCFAAAESLRLAGCRSAMVVHSEGCDEITLAGSTFVAELKDGKIREYQLIPNDFGLPVTPLDEIVGGSRESNAELFVKTLKGQASEAIMNTVAANVAALLKCAGKVDSLVDGVSRAKQIMASGAAFERLIKMAEISQRETINV